MQTIADQVDEIDKISSRIAYEIDSHEGEIIPFIEEQMELLQSKGADLADLLFHILSKLETQAEAIKALRDKYADMVQARENRVDSIREWIKSIILHMGKKELSGSLCKLRVTDHDAVRIYAPDLIPEHYIKTKTTTAPNLVEIKKQLKLGIDVPGAALNTTHGLTPSLLREVK